MTPPPRLTRSELQDWEAHRIPEADAQRWYATLHELCGPPTPQTWGLQGDETPSSCALSYALYWINAFGTPDFAGAEHWLHHFPAPYGGAELAALWHSAGWGTPTNPVRTIEAASQFAHVGASPAEADRWLAAGLTPERAAKHLAARVTLEEATGRDYDDATLAMLASLQSSPQGAPSRCDERPG